MRLSRHIAFSAAFSGVLYISLKSAGLAIASFISGILIDFDHIIDYMTRFGFPKEVDHFMRACYNDQLPKVRLLLHAWEWVFLLCLAGWMTGWNPWLTGALLGLSQHLVLDNLNNGANVLSYSLIWRWTKDFRVEKVFPKNFVKRSKMQ